MSPVHYLTAICNQLTVSRILFIWLACFTSLTVYSQNEQDPYKLGKIIPQSPNAASLGSFGNSSSGTYNGHPNISIPLFQTATAKQNINLGLNYSAAGVKPNQDASWVGLGWSLFYGGGVITRVVRGLDDLSLTKGYHYLGPLPDMLTYDGKYAKAVAQNNIDEFFLGLGKDFDGEPDIFYYNFGDHNGRFIFDKVVKGSAVLELERSNFKITYTDQGGWKIVDGDGYTYYFNTRETQEDYSVTNNDYNESYLSLYNNAPLEEFTDVDYDRYPIVTSWYLDSIVSPTNEVITFEYWREETLSPINKSEHTYHVLDLQGATSNYITFGTVQKTFRASKQEIKGAVIKKITFDNGTIEFNLGTREDVFNRYSTPGNLLNNIVIKNKAGEVVKGFNFYYSYFTDATGGNKRLKLDAVREVSNTGQLLSPFQFKYFNPGQLPPKNTLAIDHWGFYNGKASNSTLLPPILMQNPYNNVFLYVPGADRQPASTIDYVKNGILSSIVYPTGGITNFDYELNEYTNLTGDDIYTAPEEKDIYLMASAQGSAPAPDKTLEFIISELREVQFIFDYYDQQVPFQLNEFIPDYASLEKDGQPYLVFDNHPSDGSFPAYFNTQKIILTPGVYRLRLATITGYDTRLEAKWMQRDVVTQRKGGGLRVKRIENISGDGKINVKRFEYNDGEVPSGLLSAPVKYDFIVSASGFLADPTVGGSGSGVYYSRSSTTVRSNGFSVKDDIIGYSKVTEILGETGQSGKIEYYFHNNPDPGSGVPSIPYTGDLMNGKLTKTIQYDANGNKIKITEFGYEHKEVIENFGVAIVSDPFFRFGGFIKYYSNLSHWTAPTIVKETFYPETNPLVTQSNFFFENFIHKNLTRKEVQLSGGKVKITRYKYPNDFTSSANVYNTMVERNIVNPVIEQSIYGTGDVFQESAKTNYNYWYNNTWNTLSSNSALIMPYTLENKLLGNSSEIRFRYNSYDVKGNITSASKEGDVKTVYVWGYNNTYPVAEITGAAYTSVIAVLNQNIIQNPSSDQALRDELQKIRQSFPAAMVTTYTYKPLVGMTSQTNTGNQTMYYEYDGFGRLKLVRDQDNNILKQYDYQFQVQ